MVLFVPLEYVIADCLGHTDKYRNATLVYWPERPFHSGDDH